MIKFVVVLIMMLTFIIITPIVYGGIGDRPSYPLAVVSGISMEPILHSGDVVFIRKVNPSKIKVGDVIIYRWMGGKYVIHRVVSIYKFNENLCFVTWGDDRSSNPVPDPGYPTFCGYVRVKDPVTGRTVVASGVPSDEVIGKVVQVGSYILKIPYIGSLALMLRG